MALDHAARRGDLESNPLDAEEWRPARMVMVVDRRVVVDHPRAVALLAAVRDAVPQLEAFFAVTYYAACRPGEVQELRQGQLSLPASGWGQAAIVSNNPEVSPRWADDNSERKGRALKHRQPGQIRVVPLHPDLVSLLRRHLDLYGTAPDGRLFRSTGGLAVASDTYRKVWAKARAQALTKAEAASPLAARPYDLRHAAVSRWLNAGVSPQQVAEWAGHTVAVLLKIYAACIVGEEQRAMRLIDASFSAESRHEAEAQRSGRHES
jgi:integrase